MNRDESVSATPSERAWRVAEIVREILGRRQTGESVPDEKILAAHADLLPELKHALRELAFIQKAGRDAKTAPRNAGHSSNVTADSVTRAAAPSQILPGYELVGEIHRGGQGVVYQALQQSTKRKVAVKVMKEGPFAGPLDKARFDREVQILAQLRHPNIVAIHDSGTAAGCFYYVMDYIGGRALDRHIEAQKRAADWRIEDGLRLFVKICDAVNAAHLRGIIHRDLKPGNIRVDAEGEPHILDFGLAKLALQSADESTMTRTGDFVGSLPWAAPEQAEGAINRIDMRTDVYSLGVVLYRMLAGRFPYEVRGNIRDVLENIIYNEPEPPRAFDEEIDDEVETIILKCLHKEPERRYQSAGELARDLRHYLVGEPIEAKRDSLGYLLRKQLRRHKLPVAVAGAFLIVLIGGFFTSLTFWRQAVLDRDRAREAERLGNQEREAAERARQAERTQRKAAEASEEKARQRFEIMSRLAQQFMFEFNYRLYPPASAAPPRAMLIRAALEALAHLEREIANDSELQRDWGLTYLKVGDAQSDFYETGAEADLSGALASYRKGLEIFETMSAAYPDLNVGRRELALIEQRIGHVLARMGRPAEALACYRKALATREGLFAQAPPFLKAFQELWLVHDRLGALLADLGKPDEALASFRRSQQWFGAISLAPPTDAATRRDTVLAYSRTAEAQAVFAAQADMPREWRLAAWREAQAAYQRSLDILLEMRRDGLLAADDAAWLDQLAGEVARCDAAIAALERGEEPAASQAVLEIGP